MTQQSCSLIVARVIAEQHASSHPAANLVCSWPFSSHSAVSSVSAASDRQLWLQFSYRQDSIASRPVTSKAATTSLDCTTPAAQLVPAVRHHDHCTTDTSFGDCMMSHGHCHAAGWHHPHATAIRGMAGLWLVNSTLQVSCHASTLLEITVLCC